MLVPTIKKIKKINSILGKAGYKIHKNTTDMCNGFSVNYI